VAGRYGKIHVPGKGICSWEVLGTILYIVLYLLIERSLK
jgi:hypothetical protein